jgi:hypothetical protein
MEMKMNTRTPDYDEQTLQVAKLLGIRMSEAAEMVAKAGPVKKVKRQVASNDEVAF